MTVPWFVGTQQTDEGRVVSHAPGRVIVEIERDCSEPRTCAACASRGKCANARRPERIELSGTAGNPLPPVGSRVRVRRFTVNEGFAAVMVFGSPVAGALAGLWLLVCGLGGDPESVAGVAAGGGGMAAGSGFAAGVNRVLARRRGAVSLVRETDT